MQVCGHVQAVRFVVIHGRKVLSAFFDPHVACRAGAIAAAGVFQVDSKVEADVQNRLGLAVFLIRQATWFELYSLSVDGNLRHNLL